MKLLKSNIYIYIYIYILLASAIVAQEQVTTKEWQLIENCTGIEDLSYENMMGINDNSNCYIIDNQILNRSTNLFNFTPNQLTKKCTSNEFWASCPFPIILEGYLYAGASSDREYGFDGICKYDISSGKYLGFYTKDFQYINNAFIFLMDKEFYYLSKSELAHMTLQNSEENCKEEQLGTISYDQPYSIEYAPVENTSIVGFNNTVYYFSSDGLYYIDISDSNNPVNKKVESVEVTDATSVLVTDNKNRIWIINADGVIEYNTQKNTADKIANAPTNVVTRSYTRADIFKRVGFYLENNLYYIADKKVSSLDVTSQDNPDNPTKPHDQSGHRLLSCGCMGFEFIIVLFGLLLLKRRR